MLKSVAHDGSDTKVKLTTKKAIAKSIGTVRLTVNSNGIADSYSRTVDGDGDGKEGGSFAALLAKRRLHIVVALSVERRRQALVGSLGSQRRRERW